MEQLRRATMIAIASGAGLLGAEAGILNVISSAQVGPVLGGLVFGFLLGLPSSGLAIVVFRRLAGDNWRDPETRCRACGYILRGLRVPKCSECGESI